jgi:hypothetical protein
MDFLRWGRSEPFDLVVPNLCCSGVKVDQPRQDGFVNAEERRTRPACLCFEERLPNRLRGHSADKPILALVTFSLTHFPFLREG